MITFYFVCCIFWMGLILCNIDFAEEKYKLTGGKLITGVVLGLIPFVNTLCILTVIYLAFSEGKKKP